MRWEVGNGVVELVTGDITQEQTDAIVNAANGRLLPGGGVCGAIHRAAGPELARDCARIGGCPTGEVRVTPGFNLQAKYVFHAVGPVYHGNPGDEIMLASCYREALREAERMGLKSISFPAISTGIFGYPIKEAARVALRTIIEFLRQSQAGLGVRMVLFSSPDYEVHARVLRDLQHGIS
ncbi:MAG: macro domain-containing protein [Syntrophomonadaceae bacterium]|jgi:O-acetyl-ADP-ribose deacetylase (regulator of RNase III)|nr:macro domain-containing protein [Syntrophomonadaceae bacterium]